MKAVVGAGVDIGLVGLAGGLECGFVGGPGFVDALVLFGEVEQQRRADLLHIRRVRLAAIERHGGAEFGVGHRCGVRHPAAVAKAGDADLVAGGLVGHQPFDGGEEVVHQFLRIDLSLQFAAPVVIAGVAADRTQAVGRQGDEPGLGHAPGHVFDIGIEATVLVHDDDARHLALGLGRAHQIGTDLAVAPGRGIADILGDDVGVGKGDLLRQRIVGRERVEHGDRRHAAQGEGGGAVEEFAAVEFAVHVEIVELEQFGGEVSGSQTFHRRLLRWGERWQGGCAGWQQPV